ncbi:ABC transporter substrate-binding protein [Variovorax sp. JS1663]|uniref:ABC transporter substrate-binding protein n=1 Tax=Variovorax sp. JS1663 TaxID=1851577 RepID=UPI000B344910|nr:ABC transporter substrate-binding protein [Variovorax sp. JS1663]OUL97948.1 ABC transporter substrate-binding protein [Variovorax sp. JS1663]
MSPRTILIAGTLALLCASTTAATLRVANAGDALSMDPHALLEGVQLSLNSNIYEPLVDWDKQMKLAPVLATGWRRTAPTVWRFDLRRGVRFHDGTPFTADDVVFSFERANTKGSDLRNESIKEVRRIDDATVEIVTREPFPILPEAITIVYMMSRKWCVENKAEMPADARKGLENSASFRANGTGPFRLRERQASLRTVLARNTHYWQKLESNLDEVVFTPIANDATRVSALLSGDIDLMEPAPLRDVDRIRSSGKFTVLQGPDLRIIFLGMDQQRDELLYSNVKGANPLKDRRVRQAIYQAIDIETIRSRVMRNAAVPTGLMIAPGIRGFQADMNVRLPYDPVAARKLLAEAGYPNGFELGMNCPNDRYVNDAAICQAVSAQLARAGITVELRIESKSLYFPRLRRRDTSFYLTGWTSITQDAHFTLAGVMATPDGGFYGVANGGYSNPKFDELAHKIESEIDHVRREAMIREAFKIHQDDIGHIPLHQQTLAWAFSNRVTLVQLPSNRMPFKWVSLVSR